MKTNPEAYKDLLGKKLIFAYLYMGDGKGGRVTNIKEATLDIRRRGDHQDYYLRTEK